MNKREISKLVHIIPPNPELKSKAFARRLATMLGDDFYQAPLAAQNEKAGRSPPWRSAKNLAVIMVAA